MSSYINFARIYIFMYWSLAIMTLTCVIDPCELQQINCCCGIMLSLIAKSWARLLINDMSICSKVCVHNRQKMLDSLDIPDFSFNDIVDMIPDVKNWISNFKFEKYWRYATNTLVAMFDHNDIIIYY